MNFYNVLEKDKWLLWKDIEHDKNKIGNVRWGDFLNKTVIEKVIFEQRLGGGQLWGLLEE